LTFAASTFVPLRRVGSDGEIENTMPGVLQSIAEWNPVTTLANAVRRQFGNPVADEGTGQPWSIEHPALYTMIWAVAIVAVCAPLAVRAYDRSIKK
jgi:ABC-2 type transport system permease protein